MTTRKIVNFTAIITLAALIGSCSLWRKETKVTMTDRPAPVRTAVQKTTAGSTVTQIEKIESGGKVTYIVNIVRTARITKPTSPKTAQSSKVCSKPLGEHQSSLVRSRPMKLRRGLTG